MFIHSNFEKVSYEKHGFSKEINGGNHDGGGYAEADLGLLQHPRWSSL